MNYLCDFVCLLISILFYWCDLLLSLVLLQSRCLDSSSVKSEDSGTLPTRERGYKRNTSKVF